MKYISTKEAAEKWGLKERSVRELCQKGFVPNVQRSGRSWLIPDTTPRPSTGKARKLEAASEKLVLFMNPTYCEKNAFTKFAPEEETICKATDLFSQGRLEEAETILLDLIQTCSTPNYQIVAYMALIQIYGSWYGNPPKLNSIHLKLWALLKKNPDFTQTHSFLQLYRSNALDPHCITHLPSELIPLFSYIYITKKIWDSISGRIQPDLNELEFLCASLSEENNPFMLMYMHIILCVYYNIFNEKELYLHHLEKAAAIALPRKWYVPFACYSYSCAWVELKDMNENAYLEIKKFAQVILSNYVATGYFKSTLPLDVQTPTEIQVAIMISRGLSNPQIAKALDISLYQVKVCLKNIYKKTRLNNKAELKEFVDYHLKL